MKFFANLKKLNKLGASMVEYAIVLACIASMGVSVSDNLTNVLNKPFNSIASILGLASGESQTQQSAKDKADALLRNFYNGVDISGNLFDKDNLLKSLATEIASGGHQSIEEILKALNIDTLYKFDNMYLNGRDQLLRDMELIPQDAQANSAKLLTIANENGLDKSHTESFSATQYLFYKKNGKMYLAATRNIDSVTNYSMAAETANDGYSCTKKLREAKCTILGTPPEPNITFNPSDINDKFVKYQP